MVLGLVRGRVACRIARYLCLGVTAAVIAGSLILAPLKLGLPAMAADSSASLLTPGSSPPYFSATATGSLNVGRFQHTATLLLDGRILVTGGLNGGGTSTATTEIYDPSLQRWTMAPSMRHARSQHTATLLSDGRVLVAGGLIASGDTAANAEELSSVEIFDPRLNTWAPATSMLSQRALHTATPLNDGRVLVVGGSINRLASDCAELYDPVLDMWSVAGRLTGCRNGHTASLLPDGTVLIVGGVNGQSDGFLQSTLLFNPFGDRWFMGPSMVTGRVDHSATTLMDGRVLVVGGITVPATTQVAAATPSVEVFDPRTRRWSSGPSLSTALMLHSAVRLPDGRVLLVGGSTGSQLVSSTEILDTATKKWSVGRQLVTPRSDATASLLKNGQVIVVGGFAQGHALSAAAQDVYAAGDDYPAVYAAPNPPDLPDEWGFLTRECTSFAAWRMTRDGHPMTNNMSGGHFGDATNWYANAVRIGIPSSKTGLVGNVIQSASVGHVGYLLVPGAQPNLDDYNATPFPNGGGHVYANWTWYAPPSDTEYINFGSVIASGNLLSNASFETGGASPWTLEDTNYQADSIKTGGAYVGNHYLEAYTRSATPGHQSVIQTVAVSIAPNQSYTFSAGIKTDNGNSASVSIDLWALGGTSEGGGTVATVSGAWTQIQYTLNSKYSNTTLKAQLIMQTANQNFDFDGAELTMTPVANSSFETGSLSPWGLEDPSVELATVKVGGAIDGSRYLEASTSNASPGHQSVVQTIQTTIVPGQTYTLSVWVRTGNGVAGTVSVDLWALGGTMDGGSATKNVNGAWTELGYTFNARYTNSSLKVQFIMQTANQPFDFDGTLLTQSLLLNPSFETGDVSSWSLEDNNSEAYSVKSAGAIDGTYYLEAYTQNATPGHQSVIQNIAMTLAPGQSYVFSVWAKTDNGQPGTLSIDLWALGGTMEGGGTAVTVTGSWTYVQYVINTQYSNSTLKVQLIMQTANQNFDFDGASLT